MFNFQNVSLYDLPFSRRTSYVLVNRILNAKKYPSTDNWKKNKTKKNIRVHSVKIESVD